MLVLENMKSFCWMNGKIMLAERTKVSVCDIGLLRGLGVFEVVIAYGKHPFLLKEHLRRLHASARKLGLRMPVSDRQIYTAILKLLAKLREPQALIRIVLTGGGAIHGIGFNPRQPTFFITAEKVFGFPPRIYKQGAKLITFEYRRENPRVKHLNYREAARLQKIKKKAGAIEILYVFDGLVYEGATSNFFIFKSNRLITSKDGVLMGVTRGLTLKLATGKFKIEERPLKFSELKTADEAFITLTTKEVVPVVKIDNLKIGRGVVGPRTRYLMHKFKQYARGG